MTNEVAGLEAVCAFGVHSGSFTVAPCPSAWEGIFSKGTVCDVCQGLLKLFHCQHPN